MCLSESRVYMPFMPHLSSLPPIPEPAKTPGLSPDWVEIAGLVFSEQELKDVERNIQAVRRRREFRLIQGKRP